MDSMRVDCGPVRIATREELDRYMNGSAATVGRIMAPLLGAPPALTEEVARLGVAFQLTNFIRDVREDWSMDRMYLPGLDEDDLRRGEATAGTRAALAEEVGRARRLFGETAAVDAALDPSVRPGMRVARGSTAACSTAWSRSASTSSAAARGSPPGRRAGRRRARCCPPGPMTVRETKRGAERTSLDGERADVLICGASFAGLAVARELAGSGADVLLVDRYAIGERATSACAAPTPWLHAMGVAGAIRQELPCMTFTTPHGSVKYRLPWSWSSFDYRELCELLFAQCDARFETAKVEGASRRRRGAHRPRRPARAAHRRRAAAGAGCSPIRTSSRRRRR